MYLLFREKTLFTLRRMFQSPGSFLIVNAVVVLLIVGYFLSIKKTPTTSLNFKKKADASSEAMDLDDKTQSIMLNVFFNYNGHTFDAYEVLGVPAGSNLAEIKSAYQKTLTAHDDSTKPFYKAAYEAILKAQKS